MPVATSVDDDGAAEFGFHLAGVPNGFNGPGVADGELQQVGGRSVAGGDEDLIRADLNRLSHFGKPTRPIESPESIACFRIEATDIVAKDRDDLILAIEIEQNRRTVAGGAITGLPNRFSCLPIKREHGVGFVFTTGDDDEVFEHEGRGGFPPFDIGKA